MSYTLIFTAIMAVYNTSGALTVHSEHDYPTRAACQKAYDIARQQYLNVSQVRVISIQGTCMDNGYHSK